MIDTLLDDLSAWLSARDGCPAVRLEPADRGRHWQLGAGKGTVARSTAAGLLGWMTGRTRDVQITTRTGAARDTPVAVTDPGSRANGHKPGMPVRSTGRRDA